MICLLYGYLCSWFERLCGHEIAEGFVYEKEAMAEAVDSDSSWVGFTQYYRKIASNYKKSVAQGKVTQSNLHSYITQPSTNKQE